MTRTMAETKNVAIMLSHHPIYALATMTVLAAMLFSVPAHASGPARRTILNDDGCGQFGYFKAPVKVPDLYTMVDKVAGTGVTTLSVALLDGHIVWHDSEVATRVSDLKSPQATPWLYRLISVFRSLDQQGVDPMRVFVDRAHEKGLEFFACLRMNDAHGYARLSKFWQENQDLLLDDVKFDYARERTRRFRLRQIEEVCRKYDIDGFEMDFMRWPHYFRKPAKDMGLMTRFVRDVRRMMDEVGRERNKRLVLMATVPRTIGECEQIGLDVRTWVTEGIIDLLAAKNFIYFEQDLPVKQWAALVKGTGIALYAGFEHGDALEPFRAGAARYFRDGADGIYFYNFGSFGQPPNPLGRQILFELSDPKRLAGQDKHYVLLGGGPCAVKGGDPRSPQLQVPAEVSAKASKRFEMDIADDVPAALASGSLRDVKLILTTNAKTGDLRCAINGRQIEAGLRAVRDGHWEAALPGSGVKTGTNTLTLVNTSPATVTIDSVEILVRYEGSRPPASAAWVSTSGVLEAGDNRYAAEAGPWKRLSSECPSVPIELTMEKGVRATVRIASQEALSAAATVRMEFRTPPTNAGGYRWKHLYCAQPWETDQYEFKVNGHLVEKWQFIGRDAYPTDYWIWGIRFEVPADRLKAGDNIVQMLLKWREPMIDWRVPTFVHVDLFKQ